MGKKKGGKSSGNVSAGIHSNVSKSTLRAMREGYKASPERMLNQLAALRKGRNVVMTIENPNKEQTNKRFIKVKVSAKEWAEHAGKGKMGSRRSAHWI